MLYGEETPKSHNTEEENKESSSSSSEEEEGEDDASESETEKEAGNADAPARALCPSASVPVHPTESRSLRQGGEGAEVSLC